MEAWNFFLGLLFILVIETKLYHANKPNLEDLEFLSKYI